MRIKLLLIIATISAGLGMSLPISLKTEVKPHSDFIDIESIGYHYPPSSLDTTRLQEMLEKLSPTLSTLAIEKVLSAIQCAHSYKLDQKPILTIIDYSLPSSQKRLWIFNLQSHTLLFHTFVSHGINSGSLLTTNFSNRYNSKSSSMGVYLTNDAYHGREGLSLRLVGLDKGFNDNAENRAIVMHGGWYMKDSFVEKYGRPGRSWGCPAVPLELSDSIINTIKNQALLVIYYPNEDWFQSSKFLNCATTSGIMQNNEQAIPAIHAEDDVRDQVIFADVKIKQAETPPVVAMPADRYKETFHIKVPLSRMLRRQINTTEYVALSEHEMNLLATQFKDNNIYESIAFIIPQIKMERGYYITEMKIINFGKIKNIQTQTDIKQKQISLYTVYFENKTPITLHPTKQFIRWLGL